MNRKIIFSTDGVETFEIQHNCWGYRILQVVTENEAKAVSGYYANAGELFDGLAELAIFSGDDAVSLADIGKSLRNIRHSLNSYLSEQFHSPL